MIKKFLIKLVQPLIAQAVSDELDRIIRCDPPKLESIKIGYIKSGKKIDCWQALENDPQEISLCVEWVDKNGLEDFKAYRVKDLPSLKHLLCTFGIAHELFINVSLHVKPKGSTKSIVQTLINSRSDRQYNSADLPILFKPVIEWINARPELLV